jgi:MFS family permease
MYQLDWIERLKSRRGGSRSKVNPVVWKLGLTSMLTDISSEMVSSVLPIYLVMHLHMNALQYGAIDGIYNGIAMVFMSLLGGFIADRTRRPKQVAASGYALSAACKLLLFAAGSAWGWIAAIIAMDRAGKGVRTAPRDAIISLSNPDESMAGAFALHRALDAGGALLGPVIAFALLSWMPYAFDAIWLTSFIFALLGLAVILLFVDNPPCIAANNQPAVSWREMFPKLAGSGFWTLVAVGSLLSVMTVSDGFLYLFLQRRGDLPIGWFPLFYVATAFCYMLFAIPIGRAADRYGRVRVLVMGYVAVGLIYLLLLSPFASGIYGSLGCLLLIGLYYAATEGVLIAMASSLIPAEHRTTGLAVLATMVGLGKVVSSLSFGWLTQTYGDKFAIAAFGVGLTGTVIISIHLLRKLTHEKLAR